MSEHSASKDRTASRLAGYLAGSALAIGGLRGVGQTAMGVGLEWVLTPLLLGGAALVYSLSRPPTGWAAVRAPSRVHRVLLALAVADVVWTVIAVAWSSHVARGLAEAARGAATLGTVVLFWALWRDERAAPAVCLPVLIVGSAAGVLGVGAAVASRWGIVSPFVDASPHSELHAWARATGPAGTPATFAALMLGVAGVAFVARRARIIGGRSWGACLAVVGASGVASASVPGVGCVAVASWSILAGRYRRLAWVVVGSLVLFASTTIYAHAHAVRIGGWRWERPPEVGYEPLGATLHPLRTAQTGPLVVVWHWTGYARIHHAHLRTLAAHPGGIGTGAFVRVDTGPTLRTNGHWARQGHPHAWVLMRASEGGLLGLALALALWLGAGVACVRIMRTAGPGSTASSCGAGAALVVGMFLWASWFGDFLHRWDVAVLIAAALANSARTRSSVESAGIAARPSE